MSQAHRPSFQYVHFFNLDLMRPICGNRTSSAPSLIRHRASGGIRWLTKILSVDALWGCTCLCFCKRGKYFDGAMPPIILLALYEMGVLFTIESYSFREILCCSHQSRGAHSHCSCSSCRELRKPFAQKFAGRLQGQEEPRRADSLNQLEKSAAWYGCCFGGPPGGARLRKRTTRWVPGLIQRAGCWSLGSVTALLVAIRAIRS
jgi:hypothetical protein